MGSVRTDFYDYATSTSPFATRMHAMAGDNQTSGQARMSMQNFLEIK